MKEWVIRATKVDKSLKSEKRVGVFHAMFDVKVNIGADTIEEAISKAHAYLGAEYDITNVCFEEYGYLPVRNSPY